MLFFSLYRLYVLYFRFLDQWILNNSFVRAQDASGVLEDLCLNEYARDMTWDFLRANWDYIYQVYVFIT